MAGTAAKPPVKTEEKEVGRPTALQAWRPLEDLRREIDRLFYDFDRNFWLAPFRRSIFDIEPFWRREGAGAWRLRSMSSKRMTLTK
jgi:HSP20 family protein